MWYRDAQLLRPEVHPGPAGHALIGRLPSGHRIHQILTNPCYAGALVYGRTAATVVLEEGRARQNARAKKPLEQWRIVLVGHHPGSLSWEQLLRHQRIVEANRPRPEDATGGAVKRGAAVLSGVRRCGRCGRTLNGVDRGTNGRVPRSVCRGGRVERGASSCLTLGARRVNHAVATAVRDVVQPAGIQAACEALEQVMAAHATQHQAVERALEKARDEAQGARRPEDRVDPANRLVAGALDRRWNEAFVRGAEVEAHLATLASRRGAMDDEQRQRFQHLGDDLAVVWQHPTAPVALKKRMVRTVLQEIMIDTTQEPPEHRLILHWQGGVHTALHVPRNRVGQHRYVPAPEVLELIRELAKICQDRAIASTLHRLGSRTATGKTWRAHSVASMR